MRMPERLGRHRLRKIGGWPTNMARNQQTPRAERELAMLRESLEMLMAAHEHQTPMAREQATLRESRGMSIVGPERGTLLENLEMLKAAHERQMPMALPVPRTPMARGLETLAAVGLPTPTAPGRAMPRVHGLARTRMPRDRNQPALPMMAVRG